MVDILTERSRPKRPGYYGRIAVTRDLTRDHYGPMTCSRLPSGFGQLRSGRGVEKLVLSSGAVCRLKKHYRRRYLEPEEQRWYVDVRLDPADRSGANPNRYRSEVRDDENSFHGRQTCVRTVMMNRQRSNEWFVNRIIDHVQTLVVSGGHVHFRWLSDAKVIYMKKKNRYNGNLRPRHNRFKRKTRGG